MRVMTAHNSSSEGGTVSEFCYKLGLEAGGRETVLGYTAMEGFEVTSNFFAMTVTVVVRERLAIDTEVVGSNPAGVT